MMGHSVTTTTATTTATISTVMTANTQHPSMQYSLTNTKNHHGNHLGTTKNYHSNHSIHPGNHLAAI